MPSECVLIFLPPYFCYIHSTALRALAEIWGQENEGTSKTFAFAVLFIRVIGFARILDPPGP
jgi:cytochrome c biogenesis protein CcdA